MTPAAVQLLFQFAANPESASWTVRDLAAAVGLSKSKVAELRLQFAHEGIFTALGSEKSPDVTRRTQRPSRFRLQPDSAAEAGDRPLPVPGTIRGSVRGATVS